MKRIEEIDSVKLSSKRKEDEHFLEGSQLLIYIPCPKVAVDGTKAKLDSTLSMHCQTTWFF